MSSEFENTIGQFIYWSVVIGLIIISLFFRRYVTMGIWTDAGSSFACVSIIGFACFLVYKDENN